MKITRHAQQRMEERLNVKGAKAQRKHIEKVMLKGATAINTNWSSSNGIFKYLSASKSIDE
mgnify:CR=1 FL=1